MGGDGRQNVLKSDQTGRQDARESARRQPKDLHAGSDTTARYLSTMTLRTLGSTPRVPHTPRTPISVFPLHCPRPTIAAQGTARPIGCLEQLMRAAGISGHVARKRRRTTVRLPRGRFAPHLVERDFSPAGPNQTWWAETTYISTWEGFRHLAHVQDHAGRRGVEPFSRFKLQNLRRRSCRRRRPRLPPSRTRPHPTRGTRSRRQSPRADQFVRAGRHAAPSGVAARR
jgi:hypothetical protein